MIYDISCNITDTAFDNKDQNDVSVVLRRAYDHRIIPFFVGTNLETSKRSLDLAIEYNTYCYVGIHPNSATRCKDDLSEIKKLIKSKNCSDAKDYKFFSKIKNPIIAVGECGLDFYRNTATKEDQKYVFDSLLDLNEKRYFIHSRNSHRQMMDTLCDYKINAVIHSFDGGVEELKEVLKRGYYISINGHSLKNHDFLAEVDVNKIMIESDAPYCKITGTNSAYKHVRSFFREVKRTPKEAIKKSRNEPLHTIQVLEAVSGILDYPVADMEGILEKNTLEFFGL